MFKPKPPAKRRKALFATTATGAARLAPAVLDAAMSARVISVAILFVVALVGVDLTANEAFYIVNPAVVGNQRVPTEEIVAASGIQLLHVLWLQPEQVVRTLVQQMPELRSAFVWCSLPAECTIQVLEREPILEWKQNQTRTWIDADGTAFPARGQTPAIPVIEVAPDVPVLLPGRPVERELMSTLVELARALPDIPSLRYTTERGIEFIDPQSSATVYMGTGADMASRVMMWKAVAANLAARNIRPKFIDVRYPNAPFYSK